MLPFAAAWVWLLADYLDLRRVRSALALGIVLGIGCFSYIASWGVMPFLLAMSWLAFWSRRVLTFDRSEFQFLK